MENRKEAEAEERVEEESLVVYNELKLSQRRISWESRQQNLVNNYMHCIENV